MKYYKKFRKKNKKAKPDRKLCTVYGLYDENNNLRYIGQTRTRLKTRMKFFFKKMRSKRLNGIRFTPVEDWIDSGVVFNIEAIDTNATWDVSEILYIDQARREGIDLLNVLRGGQDTLCSLQRNMNHSNDFERTLAQRIPWDH